MIIKVTLSVGVLNFTSDEDNHASISTRTATGIRMALALFDDAIERGHLFSDNAGDLLAVAFMQRFSELEVKSLDEWLADNTAQLDRSERGLALRVLDICNCIQDAIDAA